MPHPLTSTTNLPPKTGWSVLVLIYLIAALRTNVIFVALFACLDIGLWLLASICELKPGGVRAGSGDKNVGTDVPFLARRDA